MTSSRPGMLAAALTLQLAMPLACPGQPGVVAEGQAGIARAQAAEGVGDGGLAADLAPDHAADDARLAGESREHTVSATEESVRLVGRTYVADGVTWLAQSGSAIEFAVSGTRVEVELAGERHVAQPEDMRPRFAVLVDGEVVLDDTLGEATRTVEVFAGDSSRDAVVEVILLSEASRGAVGVGSVTVASDAPTPIEPTETPDLRIEFVGDSITCGYGVEAAGYDDPFKTTTENFMKTYAYLAAQELGADYSTVCYSGYGVVSGWSGSGELRDDMLVPPLYGVVAEDHPEPWSFVERDNDVVVINLGTNDFTYTGTDEDRMKEFAQAYVAFLAQVREANPDACIICTFGVMGAHELYPSLERAVEEHMRATGDTRVSCYLSEEIDADAEGWGTRGHPTYATQQKSAATLVEVIRSVVPDIGRWGPLAMS